VSAPVKIGSLTVREFVRDGQPTGKWVLDIPTSMTGGKRKRKLYASRDEAVRTARELWKRIRAREWGLVEKPTRVRITIEDATTQWKKYDEDRVATLKKQRISLDTDLYRLKAVQTFFVGRFLDEIGETELVGYQKNRLSGGYSPASINSEIRSLGKVFRWGLKQKLLDAVPAVERIPEQLLADVVVPTLEEVQRIIDATPKENLALVWFLALTGCRTGEAYNLTWDCVDEVNGWVEIRPKDGWKPKNSNSTRRLPVEGILLELIRQQPKVSRFVFPSTVAPEKARTNMRKAFATAVKKAQIVRNRQPVLDIKPKYLRKAFATWQAEQGTHPRLLQALMGHAPGSTVTDRHYIKPQEEAMRAAVVRMLPAENRKKASS
jgi:integrase